MIIIFALIIVDHKRSVASNIIILIAIIIKIVVVKSDPNFPRNPWQVFSAEKMVAASGHYHRHCFRCFTCNQPLDSTRWFKIFDIIVIVIDIISTTTIITIFMCHQVLEHTWFKKFLGLTNQPLHTKQFKTHFIIHPSKNTLGM